MPVRAGDLTRWDERIARASSLAITHRAAAEPLVFYAAVARYQKSLLVDYGDPRQSSSHTKSSRMLDALDLDGVLDAIPGFLTWLPGVAPAGLAASASEMQPIDRER